VALSEREGEPGYEFQIYTPCGRPDVQVVSVHMTGARAQVNEWLADHPKSTEEQLTEVWGWAIGNPKHWARRPEDYPANSEFMFFEIDDEHRIVGPSPGPVDG
jgi:hypothetical protein